MTKREEIRERIAQTIFDWVECTAEDAADNYIIKQFRKGALNG